MFDPFIDVFARDAGGPVQTKAFATKARDRAAVNDRAAEVFIDVASDTGQISNESTDKRIAGARWIDDTLSSGRMAIILKPRCPG